MFRNIMYFGKLFKNFKLFNFVLFFLILILPVHNIKGNPLMLLKTKPKTELKNIYT